MSIWCSLPHIGTDPTVMYDLGGGMYEVDLGGDQAKGREPVEQKPERGNVLSYAEGWSNHYPDLTGVAERPAMVSLATIPAWCVPGHRDWLGVGPWLRLEVVAPEALNFWTKDGENPTVESKDATVLLDREAAESLRDDLTAWLEQEHVLPESENR